jgi:phage-related protein
MADFVYKGRKASEFGLITKSKQRPMIPDIRQRYVEIMGRDGSYDYSSNELEDRVIQVTCSFYTSNVGELRYKLRLISAWLYGPEIDNGFQDWETKTGGKGWLIFDDEPDIRYRAKIGNKIDFDQTVTMGEFDIYFRADPYSYSVEPVNSSYDGTNSNLIYYIDKNTSSPTFNQLIVDAQASAKYNTILYRTLKGTDKFLHEDIEDDEGYEFNNWGTMPVRPLIKLLGFQGDEITLDAGTKQITLDLSSWKSQPRNFTIDCENYMAYISDVAPEVNILHKMSGDFFEFRPNANFIITTGTWTAGDLYVTFNARFL